MCTAVALPWSDLPLSLIDRHRLDLRVHERGGEREVRVYWQTRPTLLPVWNPHFSIASPREPSPRLATTAMSWVGAMLYRGRRSGIAPFRTNVRANRSGRTESVYRPHMPRLFP